MINSLQPRKKFIGTLFAGVALGVALLTGASALAQTPEENAQVTLTVVNFRPLKSLTTPDYVDITTAMAPHTAVTLYDNNGVPTFRVKRAVNFEIAIAAFNSSESYRRLQSTLSKSQTQRRPPVIRMARSTSPNRFCLPASSCSATTASSAATMATTSSSS